MGAHYDSIMIQAKDIDTLKKEYQDIINQLYYEEGHDSYNGTLTTCGNGGLDIRQNVQFKKRKEADKWIMDNHEKWSGALAVKCSESPKIFQNGQWVKARGRNWWVIGGWCAS